MVEAEISDFLRLLHSGVDSKRDGAVEQDGASSAITC